MILEEITASERQEALARYNAPGGSTRIVREFEGENILGLVTSHGATYANLFDAIRENYVRAKEVLDTGEEYQLLGGTITVAQAPRFVIKAIDATIGGLVHLLTSASQHKRAEGQNLSQQLRTNMRSLLEVAAERYREENPELAEAPEEGPVQEPAVPHEEPVRGPAFQHQEPEDLLNDEDMWDDDEDEEYNFPEPEEEPVQEEPVQEEPVQEEPEIIDPESMIKDAKYDKKEDDPDYVKYIGRRQDWLNKYSSKKVDREQVYIPVEKGKTIKKEW